MIADLSNGLLWKEKVCLMATAAAGAMAMCLRFPIIRKGFLRER